MAYDLESGAYYDDAADIAAKKAADAAKLKKEQMGTYVNGVYQPLTMDGSDKQASNATAALTRAKYNDWKERFFPKVEELMNMTTYMNPALVGQEVAGATNLTNQSFDNVAAAQNRNIARFGMTQTDEQKAAQDSALSLGRTAATVGAQNNTRLMLKDRDRAIATGGLGGTV